MRLRNKQAIRLKSLTGNLLRSKDINYTIHAFRRPCDVQEVNFNEPIQKLWSNDKLSSQNKKDIVNRTTGLCEKKYNSASVCKIFDSYAEAQFYQVQNLGKIHSLRQSFKITVTTQQNYDSDFQYDKVITQTTYGKEIHLLVNEKNEMLVEGYRYIKELIYDIMSLKMYDLYNEVVSKGIVPKGIKTDAILVSKSKSEVEHLFNFTSDIGGIKFESGKKCPNRKVVQIVNEPFKVQPRTTNDIKIIDEYDKKEINQIFDNCSRVLIQGLFPGVGKTTCVLNYENHKILFVPP